MINIPSQNMEIEQIYTQIFTKQGQAIAICSADSGEGVTSLTLALAQRNLLAGHSTLVVDLNLYQPSFEHLFASTETPENSPKTISSNLFPAPQLIAAKSSTLAFIGVKAPSKRDHILKLREPGILEHCIKEWREHFDSVIIDTSPLNRINAQNIPAERVAAACDGAILVVLAGQTNATMVNAAVSKLKKNHAQLLGCVLNDRDNPSLKEELLREIDRLPTIFSRVTWFLKKMINRNRLLTLEI